MRLHVIRNVSCTTEKLFRGKEAITMKQRDSKMHIRILLVAFTNERQLKNCGKRRLKA